MHSQPAVRAIIFSTFAHLLRPSNTNLRHDSLDNRAISIQFSLLLKYLREVIQHPRDHHVSTGVRATESGSLDYREGYKP
jgi:hypothetical protein